MDDLAEKLSGILNDPESMAQVKSMAESLFSGNSGSGNAAESNPLANILGGNNSGNNALSSLLGGNNSAEGAPDVAAIMRVVNLLKSQRDDNRSCLLMALKPHLSTERQSRVDKAVKILKLVSLMPILREQGLLNFLV